MLAIACAVVILAFVLVEVSDGRVAVRGFIRYPFPETCLPRSLFGVKCPGCGLTRSIIHLAEGNWRASWRSHRLGGLMAVLILLQVPYRLLALRRPDRPMIPMRWLVVFGYVLDRAFDRELAGRRGGRTSQLGLTAPFARLVLSGPAGWDFGADLNIAVS